MHKPESVPENYTNKIFWDFEVETDLLIPTRKPDSEISNKKFKKRSHHQVKSVVLMDNRVKIKENQQIDKYLELARELTKLYNVKVNLIPTIIGPLGTVSKSLEMGLEESEIWARIETIQIIAF